MAFLSRGHDHLRHPNLEDLRVDGSLDVVTAGQNATDVQRAHEVMQHSAFADVVRGTGLSRRSTRARSRVVPLGVRRLDAHLVDENELRSWTSELPLHERARAAHVLVAVLQEGGARLALPRLLEELEGSAHGRLAHEDVEVDEQSRDHLGTRDCPGALSPGTAARRRGAENSSARGTSFCRRRGAARAECARTLRYSSSLIRILGGLLHAPVCARGARRREVVNTWTMFLTVL